MGDSPSPQGKAQRSLGLPPGLKPKSEYYDTRVSLGNETHSLAGHSIENIKLHELDWQGWNNRTGPKSVFSIKFTRSIKGATFVCSLLLTIRESNLDLDHIAESYGQESATSIPLDA